jgi:putative membrane-bound dehydrogenase-like protein
MLAWFSMTSRTCAWLSRLAAVALLVSPVDAAESLRVFIRAGVKTHGPGQHDHPRFLQEWVPLLRERGIQADGAMSFPTTEQLESTDVLVIFAADGMKIVGEERARFERFLQRGGGVVVIHDGVVSGDQHAWCKQVLGGAWIWPQFAPDKKPTKWLEGQVGLYFVDTQHPITRGLSNFEWNDEIYYDLDMAADAGVLATSFHDVFVIAPQLWTYEQTWPGGTQPYRAFVSLPGHEYTSFEQPHYRALLLRGIAWAGKRPDVDAFCRAEELGSLRYPPGGPTAPEQAAAKINVHPDFALSLVAAEPLIEKVISLDWDPQGRLWVAETPEYPSGRTIHRNDAPIFPYRVRDPERYAGRKEDRPAKDRISWLEDTDGDGRADRKHVFADFEHGVPGGLELVTSLVFYRDGVIVAQAPDILWLRDTNGDGVCDWVQRLYTGFGTHDTHAVINNFRWGLDGWIYSAIGYSAGEPKSGDGSKDFGRVTAGVIRFKPDGSALEQVASGSCNTWGFDFAADGEAFYTTATCGQHFLHIVMPEKVLARGNVGNVRASHVVPDHQNVFPAVVRHDPPYRQIDWVGMFTAASGCCLYHGGAWPDPWNGQHFLTEPTVNLVHNEILQPNGTTYVARKEPGREQTEFITSTDLWFRPIHTRVGPDGALYVVDWYNQAVIHNDTRGPAHGANNAATRPDRDHHFARLWRVQHRQARTLPPWRLDPNDPAGLVPLLAHPNGWVRQTAHRLLLEGGVAKAKADLLTVLNKDSHPVARIHALHLLNIARALDEPALAQAANDQDPIVRKNALRVLAERETNAAAETLRVVQAHLQDPDPQVQLQALIALGTFPPSADLARAVVGVWPSLSDDWQRSAAVGVAAKAPLLFVEAALAHAGAADPSFVRHVVRQLALASDAAQAAKLVALLGRAPEGADPLKQAALEALAANLKPDLVPSWNAELQAAFKALIASPNPGVPGAALPLLGRWDQAGTLGADLKPVIASLEARLTDDSLTDAARGQIAINLLGVRQMDPSIVSAVAALLKPGTPAALQRRVAEALGNTTDTAAGAALIAALPDASLELKEVLFGQITKRAEWSRALVQALADRRFPLVVLGPAYVHRLRTHPDRSVAEFANRTIDELRGPEAREKEALIARFKPEVEKPGNVERGRELFAVHCANCHVFNDVGRDLAPNLTGMGAHGPADLLVHILDPNRLVEPNFVSVSIETHNEEIYDGIIERENSREIVLRNASGDFTLQKRDVARRRVTGLSLMPEGFESLGAEGLRDLLAYLCRGDEKYRFIDLRSVFTADSTQGIYAARERREESLLFTHFGIVKVGEVPFDIVSPNKTLTGHNVLVLRGRNGLARQYPQRVEVSGLNLTASRLHFLGGVGGWAWPFGGDDTEGLTVATITVTHADGAQESWPLLNGVHVADYNSTRDVPGSRAAPGLVSRGQVRVFAKAIRNRSPITTITIESHNNLVAPTFVAITAELGEAGTAKDDPELTTASARRSAN